MAVVARQQVEHELIKEGVCCARQVDKEAEEVVVLAGRVFHDEDVDVFDDRDGRHDDDEHHFPHMSIYVVSCLAFSIVIQHVQRLNKIGIFYQ